VTILYLETNFLMSIAMGRDPEASDLLTQRPAGVQLAMPQVCCMEALSVLNEEKGHRKGLTNTLESQVAQLKRDLTSGHANALQSLLEQSIDENERLIADVTTRLFDAFDQVAKSTELIALSPAGLLSSQKDVLIPDLTDNLILHCILEHSNASPADTKVFLSGNRKDFGTQAVRDALLGAGISKYVADVKQFVGWHRSQPAP
jgi:hypothetical protein